MSDLHFPAPMDDIHKFIITGYPILFVVSWEERRVREHMLMLTSVVLKPARNFVIWSATEGFSDCDEGIQQAKGDPIAALDRVINDAEPTLYVFKDFHPFIKKRDDVVRRIRDVYDANVSSEKTLMFLGPVLEAPPELQKEIQVYDYPLPDLDEIALAIFEEMKFITTRDGFCVAPIPEEDREMLFKGFLGLTREEVRNCVRKILLSRHKIDYNDVDMILEEKRQILRKSEILEFIPPAFTMKDLGGLDVFKKWLRIRKNGFTDAAKAYGLPQPKGVLITGISGCGKSLAIQALAHEWKLPLLRLDMGRVFAGFAGSPEESMKRAILTVEAVAPAILWIDEIEMGISVFSDSVESGATSRIFASFLTWMQEKKAPVFIAATANDIDRLPPEMIRKGRFDEVFFVDLPGQNEREDIFHIHIANRGKTIADTSVKNLASQADGFTGAEIEQSIVNAMYKAFADGVELTISHIYQSLGQTVPLSVTMKEQITKTKRWADKRAVKASSALN